MILCLVMWKSPAITLPFTSADKAAAAYKKLVGLLQDDPLERPACFALENDQGASLDFMPGALVAVLLIPPDPPEKFGWVDPALSFGMAISLASAVSLLVWVVISVLWHRGP